MTSTGTKPSLKFLSRQGEEVFRTQLYYLFKGESRRWAARTGGAGVELHGYGLPRDVDTASVRRELLEELHHFYPELRGARVVAERFLLRQDCLSFAPESFERRPTVETPFPEVALTGGACGCRYRRR